MGERLEKLPRKGPGTRRALVAATWRHEVVDRGRQQRSLALLSFLACFVVVRLITYSIRYNWLPFFHDVTIGNGLHLHHLVFGILILLAVGYTAVEFEARVWRRWLAVLYGVGAALTLDEFALWLNLADVYWEREGRVSLDAIVVAAVLLGLSWVTSGFWLSLGRMALRRAAHSNDRTL